MRVTNMTLVAALGAILIAGLSCGDGSTGPGGTDIRFGAVDIDLQGGRDTVVSITNGGAGAIGPVQLVAMPVRNASGAMVPGAALQAAPTEIPTLNPGASASVALSITAPSGTPEGDYRVALEARMSSELLASAELRFRVGGGGTSTGNTVTITAGPTSFRQGDVVQFAAEVRDSTGTLVPNGPVSWSVIGSGLFDATGRFVSYSTGPIEIIARTGTSADTLDASVAGRTLSGTFTTLGHGAVDFSSCTGAMGNVLTSDLWVHGSVMYSGTHSGGCGTFYAWSLANPGQPVKSDSVVLDARVVNDVKIRSDGTLGVITHEGSSDGLNGVTLLDLTVPEHPAVITRYTTGLAAGIHNAWLEGNYLYLVTDGTNPTSGGLRILDVSNPAAPVQVAQFYGGSGFLHDVYVRDGLAMLSHWGVGLIILDVGNGVAGGSPINPVEVSRIAIPGYDVHNAWYWPQAGYVFLGDEITYPGHMLVIDVNDLSHPAQVASFSGTGATPHNFWLDESRGILYAAWYGAGLRAIDVSGELMGELQVQGRQIAQSLYNGGATMTWAPQVDNGRIYLSDFFAGVWVVQPSF